MFESITANRTGPFRVRNLKGKQYFVQPMTMIVPGVLAGSNGPLLYPEDEIKKSVHAWNNVPVVVNHPKKDGKYVSARRPDILEEYGVGYVFNTKFVDGKLKAEAWIDLDALRQVDSELASKVENGSQIEISTGLGTFNRSKVGTFNGKTYTHVAESYAPDHLAILPNEKGACSLEDGCGLAVNVSMDDLVAAYNEADTDLRFSEWVTNGVNEVCSCKGGNKPCACTKNKCKKTRNEDDEKEPKSMAINFQPTFKIEFQVNAGGCGAAGGKGRPGFQRGNTCGGGGGGGKRKSGGGGGTTYKAKHISKGDTVQLGTNPEKLKIKSAKTSGGFREVVTDTGKKFSLNPNDKVKVFSKKKKSAETERMIKKAKEFESSNPKQAAGFYRELAKSNVSITEAKQYSDKAKNLGG